MISCLFVGPSLSVITGQSKSFNDTVNIFSGVKVSYNPGLSGSLFFLFKFFFMFIFHRPNVVYFTPSRTNLGFLRDWWVIMLASLFSRRLVAHIHGNDLDSFLEHNIFARFSYRFIHTFIVLDKMFSSYYVPSYKFVVLQNFISPDFIDELDSSIFTSPIERINVLYFSNLMIEKGILVFFDMIKLSHSSGNSKKFNFVVAGEILGSKNDKKLISDEIAHLSLLDVNFSYLGPICDLKTKADIFNAADVFVLPTFYLTEAQPISIIEALASGCFVISTDQGFISNMLVGTCHSIVPKSDSSALERQLGLLNNQNINTSKKINPSIAIERYSLKEYSIRLSQILSENTNKT
jgi:glycosyltransferase involved in cell wall biosynthesis